MSERQEREAWMAMLHVRPMPERSNPFGAAVSGTGWVLALATDAAEYERLVVAEMDRIGLFITEVEGLNRYSAFTDCADHIVDAFARLSDEWPVQYHTFHTSLSDDA
jgi:hypothetical protein